MDVQTHIAELSEGQDVVFAEAGQLLDELILWMAHKLSDGHKPIPISRALTIAALVASGGSEGAVALIEKHRKAH